MIAESDLQIELRKDIAAMLYIEESSIPLDANLFHLGLDSLSAIRLVIHLRKRFNIEIRIIEVFQLATIEMISNLIVNKLNDRTANLENDLLKTGESFKRQDEPNEEIDKLA